MRESTSERRYLAKPSKGGAFHQHRQFQKGLLWDTKISFKRNFKAYRSYQSKSGWGVWDDGLFRNKNRQKKVMLVDGLDSWWGKCVQVCAHVKLRMADKMTDGWDGMGAAGLWWRLSVSNRSARSLQSRLKLTAHACLLLASCVTGIP